MQILMIEDDKYIVEACRDALKETYTLEGAYTLEEARNKLLNHHYHLILLDVELPDGLGIDFIQEIRKTHTIPIIFVSVHDEDDVISRGLDLGADDYIVKPFSLRVLLSRVNSVMRRYYGKQMNRLKFDDLLIDLEMKEVYKNDQLTLLTPIETELLFTLIQARGKILTRRFLLEKIWDSKGEFVEDNTLTVTIRRLKNKIGNGYIQTKRNVGYYFQGGIAHD